MERTTTESPDSALVERLEGLIVPVLESFGLELYELELNVHPRDGLCRVLVDRPGGFQRGEGVSVKEIVGVTRELSSLFDVEDPIRGRYRLEVFSPGIERTLTKPRHFDALIGARVKLVLQTSDAAGQSVIEGTLQGRDEDGRAMIESGEDALVAIPLDEIKRAKTLHDWSKGGRRRRS